MLYALIALTGILSFLGARSSFFPLKMAAGFGWWAFFVYWIGADIIEPSTPTHPIIMLTLLFLGIAFMLWAFQTRRGVVNVEVETSSAGAIKRIKKFMTANNEASKSSGGESASEYKLRVRHALNSGKKRKR